MYSENYPSLTSQTSHQISNQLRVGSYIQLFYQTPFLDIIRLIGAIVLGIHITWTRFWDFLVESGSLAGISFLNEGCAMTQSCA